jgi:hypothetical protein
LAAASQEDTLILSSTAGTRGTDILPAAQRMWSCGWAVALCASAILAAPATQVVLEHPVQISVHQADHAPLIGRIVDYDAQGFDLLEGKDKTLQIAWSTLDAHNTFLARAALTDPKDAPSWIDLGRDLLALPDGGPWANKAFDRALRIDPKLKEQVAQARADAVANTGAASGSSDPTAATSDSSSGPRVVGDVRSENWLKSTDAERQEQIKELQDFAAQTAVKLHRPLRAQETKYFLFYSDLPPAEALKWGGLLDRMYDRLAELFAVPHGENIWRGKGLIFVFAKAEDYRQYELQMEGAEPGNSAGITNAYGSGMVHIAFYRQENELNFAHVLVHESVHGFLHRYRSPKHIPSWANEGLAETIASELVPDPRRASFIPGLARAGLQSHHGNLEGFFTLPHIVAWQYPVAETLTIFMIKNGKRNYVDFINGMKDGLTWKESLEQRYKVELPRLVDAYGRSMGEKIDTDKLE